MRTTKNEKAAFKVVHCNPSRTNPATPQLQIASVNEAHKPCTCADCKPPKRVLPQGTRRIKIQPKYVARTYSQKTVPQIILTSEWLRKTGFEFNRYILIEQKAGKLIIHLEKKQK